MTWPDGSMMKADVEEAIRNLGMAGLGLGHHIAALLLRDFAKCVGLFPGYVDGAFMGEVDMVEV
jgi:hypothetical protein